MNPNVETLSVEEKRALLKELRVGHCRGEQHGNYWTPNEDELLKRYYYEGYDYGELALLLGRGESSIINRCSKLKLFVSSRKPYQKSTANECLCTQCTLQNTCSRRNMA